MERKSDKMERALDEHAGCRDRLPYFAKRSAAEKDSNEPLKRCYGKRGATCFPALAYNSARSMMLLAKSTTGTKVLGTRPRMRSETGFFTRRGHLKPHFGIRQQHRSMAAPLALQLRVPFSRKKHPSFCTCSVRVLCKFGPERGRKRRSKEDHVTLNTSNLSSATVMLTLQLQR